MITFHIPGSHSTSSSVSSTSFSDALALEKSKRDEEQSFLGAHFEHFADGVIQVSKPSYATTMHVNF